MSLMRWLLLSFSLLAACAEEPTALRVWVRSTSLTPGVDVTSLSFRVMSAAGEEGAGVYDVTTPWPQTLVVYPRDSSALPGELRVRVEGRLGAFLVASSEATTTFEPGRVVELSLNLGDPPADDAGVDMGPIVDEDGGVDMGVFPPDASRDMFTSVDMTVPVDMSVPVDMTAPVDMFVPIDMTLPPDACVPLTETCNDRDDDCDGDADEGIPCLGSVLLSEVSTGYTGTNSSSNEFIELYNTTNFPVAIGGMEIDYRSAEGSSWNTRATLLTGSVIPAHGYFLVASTNYSGGVAADYDNAWTSSGGLADSGGHVRIVHGGVELDRLGWGTANMALGGTAVPAATNTGSYERKANAASTAESMATGGTDELAGNGYDTRNNAADFVVCAMRGPQNSSSPAEAP